MNHKLLFYFLAFFIGLSGCYTKNRAALKEVTTLEKKVDSLQNVISKLNLDEANKQLKINEQRIDPLKENIDYLEEIDKDYIKYFGPYLTSIKVVTRILNKKMPQLNSEFALSVKQLDDLKHDIKNDLIPADTIQIFLQAEKEAVRKINNEVTAIESNLKQQQEAFEQTNDKILELIKKVENKK